MMRRGAAILGFFAVLSVGCKSKAKLLADAKQTSTTMDVTVTVDPPAKGTLTFKGSPGFEKLGPVPVKMGETVAVSAPLADVPIGKATVTMNFTGEGRGLAKSVVGQGSFSFDRVASTPRLKLRAGTKGATDLRCKGDLCDSGTHLPVGPDAHVSVELVDCDGCTIDVGGQKISVKGARMPANIDLTLVVANASTSDLGTISDMKVPFKITSPEGGTTESSIEVLGSVLGGIVLRRAAQGPLKLPDEPAGTGHPKSAAYVRKEITHGVVRTVGSASRVKDIDLVGIVTPIEKSLGSCGTYHKESDPNAKVKVDHIGVTFDVSMIDRRTGKPVGHRSFPPVNRQCYDTLAGGTKTIFDYPADADLDAWAKTFFK